MKGKAKAGSKVLDVLAGLLKNELTAINQYFLHYEITEHLGYKKLAKIRREQSMHEMKHAEWAIERMLFLEGAPNVSAYGPIRIGYDIQEGLQYDLDLEKDASAYLTNGIQTCYTEGDHVTRELLEKIAKDEDDHIDWLKTQLELIDAVGYNNYLAQHMEPGED